MSVLFLAIPLTIFVLFVAPIWLWLHYSNRQQSGARNAYKPRTERNGYAEEWAYGLMGTLQSGFTQGLIGRAMVVRPRIVELHL